MPIDSANRRAIARRLTELRKRAGYPSQRAFARAVGVSGGLVAQWENASKCPGRANLQKIAQLCGVPVDYILTDTIVLDPVPDSQVYRTQELVRLFEALPVHVQKNLVQLARQMYDLVHVNDKESQDA